MLGLDGATFTVLDPLIERGVMPFLGSLAAGGVRATLASITPPLTPPAWTSLMTGKRPGEHGVYDFFQKDAPDSEYFHFASSQDVGSATIWSVASAHGKRVVSLNFPLMFPPPDVDGYVVPGGWMPWRQLRLGCHPPGLFDRLKTLPSFEPKELALDMKLEAKAIEGCAEEEYVEWIQLHTRREQRWFEILRYLLAEDDSVDLVAVMFDGPDKLQHLCWRFIDPALRPADPTPWEAEILELCDGYFRSLDALLAAIVELAGPDPTVVVASDHGFGPTRDLFYVNAWLEQQGYLAWAETDAAAPEQDPQIGFSQMMRHVFTLDWTKTVAYAATPSSQGIHLVRREGDARSEQEYERAGGRDRRGPPGAPASRGRAAARARRQAAQGRVRGPVRGAGARSDARAGRRRGRLDPQLRHARAEARRAVRQPSSRGHLLRERPFHPLGSAHRGAVHPRRRAAAPLQPRRAGAARHVRPDSRARRSSRASWSGGLRALSPATRPGQRPPAMGSSTTPTSRRRS